jgi:hypothetical protein
VDRPGRADARRLKKRARDARRRPPGVKLAVMTRAPLIATGWLDQASADNGLAIGHAIADAAKG